jgi:predicted dehydrogenase
MNAVSVGVVGAGTIARETHLAVLSCMPDVQVQWICDANGDRARAVGRANGIRGFDAASPGQLPQCDAVLLAIPVGARAPYFDVFGNRGTAILAEKPFAASAHEHRVLVERLAPFNLGCGYMRRFYDSTQLLRHLVRTRPFGPLLRIQVSEGSRVTSSRVDHSYLDDARQSASGGILSELGCHSLDVALFVTGANGYEIRASEFVFDGAVDRKIKATIRLTDSKYLPGAGVLLDYCVSWLDRQSNTVVFDFEKTSVWTGVGPEAGVYMGTPARASDATRLVPAIRAATSYYQAFYLQWRAFLDGLGSRTESGISARSALLGATLIEDLYLTGRHHA